MLLLVVRQAAGFPLPVAAQSFRGGTPTPKAAAADARATAFDKLYADLRGTGLATQPDQAAIDRRLAALAALVPPGDTARQLRSRAYWGAVSYSPVRYKRR